MCVICPIVIGAVALAAVFKARKEDKMQAKHGWFSRRQLCLTGRSQIYLTPNGKEAQTTQVTDDYEHNTAFDDIRWVGMVDQFVREVEPNSRTAGPFDF